MSNSLLKIHFNRWSTEKGSKGTGQTEEVATEAPSVPLSAISRRGSRSTEDDQKR